MRFGRALPSITAPLLVLFLSLFFFQPSVAGRLNSVEDPAIFWAFGALRAGSGVPKAAPVHSGMVLKTGDKLKMMVRMRAKCFVYLIHKDSRGDLTMLFPYSLKQAGSDYRLDCNYYVPAGEGWFELDDRTGMETFYLIASDQRLLDIEYTYEKYVASRGTKDKRDLCAEMVSELDSIGRKHFASSGGAGPVAGPRNLVRGFERAAGADPTDITGMAKEISFNNIYSQTIVIEHK